MSSETFLNGRVTLHCGDGLDILRTLPEASIDACVTDPPYALVSIGKRFGKAGAAACVVPEGRSGAYARASAGFMGKTWDTGERAFAVEFWAEVYRVLKPGGHVLAFGGTRTVHRLTCAIEDAGFEIRDMVAWLYGCLDEQTQAVTKDGVTPYHKIKVGDPVLCYDVETGTYSYQPVLEVVDYDYADTAYRIVGDFGEQIVSRNHRCIVERGGVELFQLAETWDHEARVPILESLHELQQALRDADEGTSDPQQDVQSGLRESSDRGRKLGHLGARGQGRADDLVRDLSAGGLETECLAEEGGQADVQLALQRGAAWGGLEGARQQGKGKLAPDLRGGADRPHDWGQQSGLERRPDLSQPEGGVCQSADQVRALSGTVSFDGSEGWVRDGAPFDCGEGDRATVDPRRGGASHQSRCDGQRRDKPDALRDERRAQGVRAWRGHRSAVVRVVPFHYIGKVWCLRVPTGAFVAVRNGVAFPTGNSGFPKSHDVSKGIDRAAGLEREVVGESPFASRKPNGWAGVNSVGLSATQGALVTAAASEAARRWEGWGTALKPALEPITFARKPLQGTVAENVLTHGTGAVNVAGCRVPMGGGDSKPIIERSARTVSRENYRTGGGVVVGESTEGRWPANVILDGSDEVAAAFPDAPGQQFTVGPQHGVRDSVNCYGDYGARPLTAPRGDAGSAARFFYNAKADGDDRVGSKHPTVKPVDLMRYLVRLVTPPGGMVLDPFAGTGTTGAAAYYEGFSAVLCERETEYQADIRRRMALCLAGPEERRRAIVKAKAKPDDLTGTLFAPSPVIAAE